MNQMDGQSGDAYKMWKCKCGNV